MDRHFEGVIGRDWRTSTPWWPPEPEPPAGAPNVLLLVLDDVGFAQLGCYGSDISTPTFDGLARDGVRLTNFHTTALCSPTRSCLLTGRNHHRNGMGRVADLAVGYPGYWGRIPRENGFLSEILARARLRDLRGRQVAPHARRRDPHGRVAASWPLARGFDRWYGFHGGETHQFVPSLYHDNHSVLPPARPEDGYHLSADLADRAIGFIGDLRAVDADRPFFCYFATGACHSPHHAPPEWIERYRGQFDGGWDAWREATFAAPDRRGRAPRAHAAVARARTGCRRGTRSRPRTARSRPASWSASPRTCRTPTRRSAGCSRSSTQTGDLDNTLIVAVSDNGASAEGGPKGSINDGRLMNGAPAGRRELARAHRRDRRPDRAQQLPVGLDDGGQHAVQALEARGARRRGRRPVHRVDAGHRPDPRRDPAPVRATRSTCCPRSSTSSASTCPAQIDGVAQSRVDGAELRIGAARRRTRPRRTRPNTSRCSARAASTTAVGRR